MNADQRVMEHFPAPLSAAQSDDFVDRLIARWDEGGPSLWAVELPGRADFIGFIGLLAPTFDAIFTPCVEVGWRLAADHWGRGYAAEGASAALTYGFDTLGLDEVVSFTSVDNTKSRRVMEKLGMEHEPADDFDHPNLEEGHRLRRHVLYRVTAPQWQQRRESA